MDLPRQARVVANREWTNLQIRHVWCLLPFTLIGPARVLQRLPEASRRWGRATLALTLAGLLLLNAGVFARLQDFSRPLQGTLHDRDYYTYLYTHAKDPQRAREYLRTGR